MTGRYSTDLDPVSDVNTDHGKKLYALCQFRSHIDVGPLDMAEVLKRLRANFLK